MTSVEAAAVEATASPAKFKKPRAKGQPKPEKPSSHPPVNDMVVAAISTLKARNGSSLQAIKKYIAANYKCDVAKLAPFLRKALKKGVEKGTFMQTKGTGVPGSFKLLTEAKKAAAAERKPKPKKATTTGKEENKRKPKAKQPGGGMSAKKTTAATKQAAGVKKAAAPKHQTFQDRCEEAETEEGDCPAKKATPKKAAAKK